MTEIIPSINVRTFADLQERIKKVEPFVKWCHLDVTDGAFSAHETWRNPEDLARLDTTLAVEVHLMVSSPDAVIDSWLTPPVKRIIVHAEVLQDFEMLVEKCRDEGIEVGIAIKPETSWELLRPYLGKADMLQVLTVNPGPSGQSVNWPEMQDKIKRIHEACPECMIEVDGGINPHTYKNAVSAGASLLVAGAFIFNSSDVRAAIEDLKK